MNLRRMPIDSIRGAQPASWNIPFPRITRPIISPPGADFDACDLKQNSPMNPLRFFTLVATLALAPAFSSKGEEAVAGQRIVVTGHSFHLPVMATFDVIAKSAKIPGHQIVVRQMIGGSKVSQHWDLPDEKNTAKSTLRAGGVDVMTMSPNWIVPDEAIEKFVNLGLEKSPQMRALVQVSWYPWDGMNPPQKVAKNEDRDGKTVADLRAAYDPFRDIIRKQAREINERLGRQVVYVVPVGEAVLRLREKVIAGGVPGITRQSELFSDPIGHAKPPVLWLAAFCQFACIYRRDPAEVTFTEPVPGRPAPELEQLLKRIAWEAALDEPLSGLKAAAAKARKP
jgi:hypothetical protein